MPWPARILKRNRSQSLVSNVWYQTSASGRDDLLTSADQRSRRSVVLANTRESVVELYAAQPCLFLVSSFFFLFFLAGPDPWKRCDRLQDSRSWQRARRFASLLRGFNSGSRASLLESHSVSALSCDFHCMRSRYVNGRGCAEDDVVFRFVDIRKRGTQGRLETEKKGSGGFQKEDLHAAHKALRIGGASRCGTIDSDSTRRTQCPSHSTSDSSNLIYIHVVSSHHHLYGAV